MKKILIKISILTFIFYAFYVSSQENVRLTITPPLIKVNFNPGQVWQSSVKIVNNNPQDLNIFVTVMDFKSGPEGGVVFIREKTEQDKKFLLSEWIDFPKKEILIPAFQSEIIPFTIRVPENAEPGGKYAAILAGIKPPELKGPAIKITPLVSCLILANVRGNVKEEIWIREFSTDKTFYQTLKVNFTLKIENIGNVHVQPQGEIKIFNMYGKERGVISLNQNTEYGNVLPQSSRKWNFYWEGEDSLFEIGKYKAILNLTYGNEIKQTQTREINFYFLPVVPLIAILGTIFLIFVLIVLIARLYVKRAVLATLLEATKKIDLERKKEEKKIPILAKIKEKKISDIFEKKEKEEKKEISFKISATQKKKFFFPIILILILIFLVLISIYFLGAFKEKRKYKIETQFEKEQISPEKLIEKIEKEEIGVKKKKEEIDKKSFSISILNGTGIKGLANEVGKKLRENGFVIEKIGNADNFNYQKTLIKYKKGKGREGEFLNKFFGGRFKLEEVENQKEDIILIIGKDFSF